MNNLFTLLIFIFFFSSFSFAQEVTCQYEYETHYNECQVCFQRNNTYKIKITSISDYRYLASVYLDFRDATRYKSNEMQYRGSCHYGHKLMEYNPPFIEKFNNKYKQNQNENWTFSYSTQIINGQNLPTELKNACSSISAKYDLWKKFAEQEQAKVKTEQDKKRIEENKIEQQRLDAQKQNKNVVSPKIDSLLAINNYNAARLLTQQQNLDYFTKNEFYKKIDSLLINYLIVIIESNDLKKFDDLINIEKQNETLPSLNQNIINQLVAKRNLRENELIFENLILPIKDKELTSDENLLIGDWDFKSKNLNYREGKKNYFADVIRFNQDRTFYYQIKEYYSLDNYSEWMQEKTGYWKYENGILTLFIDYETTNKNKVRVNKIENITFQNLDEKESEKTIELQPIGKFNMKGKKRQ